VNNLINFLTAGILAAAPLLFGVLGEILTEKSGNLNLGVEGMMFMGGIGGIMGAYYYERAVSEPVAMVSALIAIACAMLTAAFGALLYSVITITFRANQNVTGLALSIFGVGFGNFFGEAVSSADPSRVLAVGDVTRAAFNSAIFPPALVKLPYIGKLLFSHNFMVYAAVILALLMSLFLYRSRKGLNLRAVGESPATADAAGVNVTLYKYLATCVGGGICGLGGLYLVMNASCGVGGAWVHNCIDGYGWLAVALVIFSVWSPARAVACALIFGGLSVMRYYYPIPLIPSSIYDIMPYVATAVVLVAVSIRHSRKSQPPASLGLAYFREER
jgi:simple sugar transport system permease protein